MRFSLAFSCFFGVALNLFLPPLIIFSKVWFTIFENHSSGNCFLGSASFVLFKSLIEGQPIRDCIKHPVDRPLNHIFLMLMRCTAANVQ